MRDRLTLVARLRLVWLLALVGIALYPADGHSQVTTAITSSGLGTVVTPSGTTFSITGGSRAGSNLFHSFGLFSVGATDTARFTNTTGAGVTNVLGRVTGGEVSKIFGTIDTQTSMPGANLFLLNPAGVVFGPGARLNVSGSVHVSTGQYVGFSDGGRFFADPAQPTVLSVANPVSFGFLAANPALITVDGSQLRVTSGKTLSLVGGDVQITGTAGVNTPTIGPVNLASNVSIQIASVASPGEAIVTPGLNVGSFSQLGAVTLSNNARLDASGAVTGTQGGAIVIRGGSVTATGSTLSAITTGNTNGAALGVDLQAAGNMTLSGSSIQVGAQRNGNGGAVQISAGNLQMKDGAVISTTTSGGVAGNSAVGVGGNVSVNVGTLTMTGTSRINTTTQRGIGPGGPGGTIAVTATGPVTISDANSGLTSTTVATAASGVGGKITISAPSLTLDSASTVKTTTGAGSAARSGDVTINVNDLTMAGGAQVSSQAASNTAGAAGGNLIVRATDKVDMSGASTSGAATAIITLGSAAAPTAVVGDISMNAGRLILSDRAAIQSGSVAGRTGSLALSATEGVTITNGGSISSQAFAQDVGTVTLSAPSLFIDNGFISTSTTGGGRAGNASINVGTLTLQNGGQILSSSEINAPGAGGNLGVNATNGVSISGSSPTGSRLLLFTTDPSSGLFSRATGTGDAGAVSVVTPSLTLANGGKISVATSGSGKAGDVSVTATNGAVSIGGNARIDSGTTGAGHGGNITIDASGGQLAISGGAGLFSNAGGSGAGGDINVRAQQVNLGGGGVISAKSTGTADALAGNVSIRFGDTFAINGGAITTQSAVADGGNISIASTGSLLHLVDGQITTSVQGGTGSGGNIVIGSTEHPIGQLVLDGSQIRADAFGGPGGNINISAGIYLTQGSVVSASSALNTPGTIDVQARVTDLSRNVARLPENVLKAALLLRASCTARLASGKSSSLVLAGREGVPPEPDGLLWSPLLRDDPVAMAPSTIENLQAELLPRFLRASLDPKCAR